MPPKVGWSFINICQSEPVEDLAERIMLRQAQHDTTDNNNYAKGL
jgi:hypothetical protein